jgi:ATP-dependent DNA helicase RecG
LFQGHGFIVIYNMAHEKAKILPSDPVSAVKGVGPTLTKALAGKGIATIEDLLYFLPLRYEDHRDLKQIGDLQEGERATIVASVVEGRSLYFRHARRKAYETVVEDGTGLISLKWFQFNRPFVSMMSRKGTILLVSGSVSKHAGTLQMIHPHVTSLEDAVEAESHRGVMAVYPEVEGIKPGVARNVMRCAVEACCGAMRSLIPEQTARRAGLIPLGEALSRIHLPEEGMTEEDLRSCRERLVLEEYFSFQAALVMRKNQRAAGAGIALSPGRDRHRRFLETLPFKLTKSQRRVAGEIVSDMARPRPMNRLLQGDVGSGKTICAVLAAAIAVDNDFQVAVMAPTEILAEQHYLTFRRYFEGLDAQVVLVRGGAGRSREGLIQGIRDGSTSIVVGTHALIQRTVIFRRLGLAVIDEQHRFGVVQRKVLREKGAPVSGDERSDPRTAVQPDVLVMTATPIPRTLSMAVYGDLDVSTIDELPPGRRPVATMVYLDSRRDAAFGVVREELEKGRQAFIVYPLVEESEKLELLDAKRMELQCREIIFPEYRVGLLHGRMAVNEKERMMLKLREGSIDVLVCTTVIEVGIDVPNATVILVDHAERFGLSQLHQLRGRIGRGPHPSRCLLVAGEKRTGLATKRLKAMEGCHDGFAIAEEDLKIRGPGEIFGTRQSGMPPLRVGDIVRDGAIMTRARRLAEEALDVLSRGELKSLRVIAEAKWGTPGDLDGVG